MDSAPPPPVPPTAGARIAAALHARTKAILDELAVSRRARNVTGFIFIIAGLLSSVAAATIDGEAADLTGRFGIWSAHLLFALFGKAAYLFGPALIWSGLRGIARDDWQAYLSGVIGNLALLWSLAVFFYLTGRADAGIAGEQFGLLLEFFTGRTGAYTINSLLMFTGLLLLLQIPFDRVKERVIDVLEGRPSAESGSAVWLKRIMAILPLLPMAYGIYRQFRKPRKTQQEEQEPANTSKEEAAETIQEEKEASGGTAVLHRFRSKDRPPWIQKVVVDDEGLSDLQEITDAALSEAETSGSESFEPLPSPEPEIDGPDASTNTDTAGNRWRPGYGFDSTEEEYHPFPDDDRRHEGSLVIEEDRFPVTASRTERPVRRSTSRIIYDPVKNRYLFRQGPEEQHSRQGLELLDRMEVDLPHHWQESSAVHEREAFDERAEAQSVVSEPPVEKVVMHTDDYAPDDRAEEQQIEESESVTAFAAEDEQAEAEEGQEEQEETAPLTARPQEPAPGPTQQLLPNINMPPVVLSENRFSRYRLSRRIVKQSPRVEAEDPEAEIRENWQRLEKVLSDYGVQAKVVGAIRGPMITMYEVLPEPGVRVNRILGIQDEIRMHLAALSVRILAPIPGKSTIGIELPNRIRQYVSMGDLANGDPEFSSGKRELSIALGKDITGTNRYLDLAKLPHLLIAGATGSGKSVFMNSVIGSLLFNHSPDEVRFLMIDPKMVELKLFEGIPHLLHPVITDIRLADRALSWAVQEMEARYQLLSGVKCRDIRSYNDRIKAGTLSGKLMPYIVILIDELSDLMMVAAKEVEDSIIRLTQKARAVGIHVIMATQRPSVDVITALIKANCPARISFQVAQRTDSRVILDTNGAEALLGRGDMLYKSPTAADPARIQSPMISDTEIEQLVAEASRFGQPRFIELPGKESDDGIDTAAVDVDQALLDAAWEIIQESGKTSTSYVQRRLRIGYNRAATIVEKLEQLGYLGPAIGNRPREILKRH